MTTLAQAVESVNSLTETANSVIDRFNNNLDADGNIVNSLKLEGRDLAHVSAPVGTVITIATTSVPDNYLECNGASLSKNVYSHLYGVVGDTFGNADDDHFYLPDLRGEFIRGWDNGRNVDTDREFGSFQRGTIFIAPRDHELSSVVRRESATDVSDPYDHNGYYDNEKHGSDGLTDNGYKRDGSEDSHWRHSRPRNIALLFCIKYN